ncbi:probable RNA methyltransferase CG11342 [Musca vetustissima]|uniref:probable RNA methyltransferase CG11342 n=1 Tax=Musca vetustissima TaxID=27455 RepID=UPI002AB7BB6C|nr:probable RNA methyltransferase CG11342 [Musca vetustissima]
MEFRNKDPGAVQYGNFINYYQFNSAEERLKLLPTEHWSADDDEQNAPYLVLDVGCNSGVFTQLLYGYLSKLLPQRKILVYGVDIDDALIKRAIAENNCDSIAFDCVDVMDNNAFEKVTEYLAKHQRSKFDAICCFSITMWIHLNHHDAGLQEFLRKLSSLAKLFVVEPQPWKCYQTAERRLKKSGEVFPLFLDLKWRSQVEDEIQNYLESTLQRRKVYESCPTKWKRKICFYR